MTAEEEKSMKKPSLKTRLGEGLDWFRRQDALYLGMLSLFVGLLAGYGALFLRLGIEEVSLLWTGERTWSNALNAIPWYLYIVAPVTGGLLVGLINTRVLDPDQHRVIPGVIEALSERGGRISVRKALGEVSSSIIAIGSGASMGREAPTVALGAALASLVGQKLGLTEKQLRTLLGCGVAAGIAASFNAPIAGVLFALEVILADYAVATFTPIVLASVIATVITRAELGNYPVFTIPEFELVSGWEIPAYLALGVICGVIAAFIIKALPVVRSVFESRVKNRIFHPIIAGFLLGCVALFLPEIMSIGYGTVESILLESIVVDSLGWELPLLLFLAVLIVAKVATSVICSAGGFGGGMIGPSLFIGATTGALFGYIAHDIFPGYSETFGAYALVGAGALLAATVQAPMSMILMIFEISGNYQVMVPLMTACVVAALVKRAFGSESVITESLEAKGIETGWGLERSWMRAVPIKRIPWRSIPTVSEHVRLEELKRVYISSGKGCVQVTDDDGLMVGLVTFEDLKEWLLDPTLDHAVVASEVVNRNVRTVSEKGSLLDAVNIFDREEFEQMPVVAADEPRRVLGILSRNAVFSTYHKLIVKHGEASDHTHV
jgi:CIC family chloride channel protein